MPDTKIVISGISGVYPKCDNIAELAEKLFAKEDLITDLPGINFSAGKLNSVNKFDSGFFDITNEHAEYMDPMCRILLEKTYEAIVDAGYNPQELRNSNTAVFVANCTSDAEVESTLRSDVKGALICERAQSFLANRISYCFDLYGPSGTVNTACSSSLYALDFACKAMRNNKCEAAIVGGSNLCLAPGMIQLYKNLGITSSRCRSFDDAAIGFCRSEAICVILLQREEMARRKYAEVVHVKTNNDGYKTQSILFPSHRMQTKLINEVYQECGVSKEEVSWVEAHGTGTRVGDYQEMKSLETLYENRTSPLLAGCVKSCLGHTEAASGLCAIAKVIIAMEKKCIPANLHFSKPQNGIKALQQDKIRIITETTPWNGGYVAINNFGIGGANAHLLLKSNLQENSPARKSEIPSLVTASGRTADAVNVIISYLSSNPINVEFDALLRKVFSVNVPNHDYRGYIVLGESTNTSQIKQVKNIKRPVWFIYPGMGSKWPGVAKQLMLIDIFKQSILESHSILLRKDVNLLELLMSKNADLQKNILNCFIGITAIMLALTDLLTFLGIEPDGLIGHSFGEIGCAYADKCVNKEEALLISYYRGITSIQNKTTEGMMAVIGLSGTAVEKLCPQSIEVVCYNGVKSCTIAGPVNEVQAFIHRLKSENTFAVDIYSASIAYHSSYIRALGPVYRTYLQKVIQENRSRSSKWISSSIDESQPVNFGKHCSAEYFENNLLKPVHFEDALKHIPNNAITVELAPSSIFKFILDTTLNATISNICLTNKSNPHGVMHGLLTSLGTLYNEGVDMDIGRLYPPVPFPVSRGTPMISPLIRWNHQTNWYVPFETFDPVASLVSNENKIVVSYENEEWRYLRDHVIDGVNVFPESGFLKIVWDVALQRNNSVGISTPSVTFKDVFFYHRIEIPPKEILRFEVILTRLTGYFEIILKESVIVKGYIYLDDDTHTSKQCFPSDLSTAPLKSEDLYKELKIKGFEYGNQFQTLVESNVEGSTGKVKWTNNWVTYLDGLFQLIYLHIADLNKVTRIGFLSISQDGSNYYTEQTTEILAHLQTSPNTVVNSGAVRMTDIAMEKVEREIPNEPVLQSFEFIPYFDSKTLTLTQAVQIILALVLENNLTSRINIHEFTYNDKNLISREIQNYFQTLSFYKADFTIHNKNSPHLLEKFSNFHVTDESCEFENKNNIHLIILAYSEISIVLSSKSLNALRAGSNFILTRAAKLDILSNKIAGFEMSAEYHLDSEKIVLWHKASLLLQVVSRYDSIVYVNIVVESFNWIRVLQTFIKRNSRSKIILYSKQKHSGIIGLFNCIRKETYGQNIRCFLVLDSKVPSPFNSQNIFFSEQLKSDMAINVYKNDCWGSYVPLKLAQNTVAGIPQSIQANPKFICSPHNSYIICGGLGGMGFELADWLVSRGARKLILVSRTGYRDGYQLRKISRWRRESGVILEISIENIICEQGVRNLLQNANKLGSVAAIFNTTLLLQDELFENQTEDSFRVAANPKAIATILLDRISRELCPQLQHFVVFSSIACGYGNAGQSNYGFANSVMERICEMRRDEALPGVAIEWAGVGDVGYLQKASVGTIPAGTLLQPIRSCLNTLDLFLNQDRSIVTSFIVATSKNNERPTSDSKFATIKKIIDKTDVQLEAGTTLKDIGLDSIVAAETKNILEQEFNIFMNTKEILNIKITDLWELEKTKKFSPDFRGDKSIQKLSVLEEIYSNLFRIMSSYEEILNLKLLIRLPSLLHNGASEEIPLSNEPTIFFLPSIEGFASVMQPLAKNIDLQVLCGQYNLQTTCIKQITNLLLPEIEKRLICSEPFHLLGYSYGGLLAMEITHALEKKGRTGFVYIVDSSPVIVKYISDTLFKDRGFQTNSLAFVRALNCGVDLQKFENDLQVQKSWPEINKLTINSLPNSIPHNKENLRMVLDALHARIDDIDLYKGTPKKSLISKVFFFKPTHSLFDIPSQQELSEYCCSSVQQFSIPGDHFTILKSDKLAYYIRSLCKTAKIRV